MLGLIERRSPQIRRLIAQLDDDLARSPFVTADLLHGVEAATRTDRDDRRATLDRYLRITVAPDGPELVDELLEPYSRISALAGGLRPRAGQNDRWILAEAELRGVSCLITEDLAQAVLARELFGDDVDVVHVTAVA